MHPNEQNTYGCPLRNQTGIVAIHDFDAIVAGLSPELRAAFAQERAARQVEIESIITADSYQA